MGRTSLVLGALAVSALAVPADARTIKNDELNFTLVVPDRLQSIAPQGDMLAAFATSDPAQGVPEAVVSITRLHGLIGHDQIDPSKVPGVSNIRVRQEKWKTFDIGVFEGQVARGDVRMAVCGAQIPLKREAIQINIAVPPGKEAEANALMAELLAGLNGPSNWLTDDERDERLGKQIGGLVGAAAVIGICFFVAIRWQRRSRRASSG